MNTIDVLRQFITEELLDNATSIDDDDFLLADGLVDSIGMMRFVAFIEETYDLEIPTEDIVIENFRSLSLIADYVHKSG